MCKHSHMSTTLWNAIWHHYTSKLHWQCHPRGNTALTRSHLSWQFDDEEMEGDTLERAAIDAFDEVSQLLVSVTIHPLAVHRSLTKLLLEHHTCHHHHGQWVIGQHWGPSSFAAKEASGCYYHHRQWVIGQCWGPSSFTAKEALGCHHHHGWRVIGWHWGPSFIEKEGFGTGNRAQREWINCSLHSHYNSGKYSNPGSYHTFPPWSHVPHHASMPPSTNILDIHRQLSQR